MLLGPSSGYAWTADYRRSPEVIRFALALAGKEVPRPDWIAEVSFGRSIPLIISAGCRANTRFVGFEIADGSQAPGAEWLSLDAALPNLTWRGLDLASEPTAVAPSSCPGIVIVSHVWSWMLETERKRLCDLLFRFVPADGLVCIDCCILPGMQAFLGLKQLVRTLGADGGQHASASPVWGKVTQFLDTNPDFVSLHWRLRGLVERFAKGEADTEEVRRLSWRWRPDYFADIARTFHEIGFSWLAPWSPTDGIDELHLTPEQGQFLEWLSDASAREQLRDFTIDRAQRADVWIKSASIPKRDALEPATACRLALLRPKHQFSFAYASRWGELALARPLYSALLDGLRDDHPMPLSALTRTVARQFTPRECLQAVAIFLEQGMAQLVNSDDAEIRQSVPQARALNRKIFGIAGTRNGLPYIASPLTGAAVPAPREHQLFLLARERGARTAWEMALAAEAAIEDVSERSDLHRKGETKAAALTAKAEMFLREHLEIYRTLLIAE